MSASKSIPSATLVRSLSIAAAAISISLLSACAGIGIDKLPPGSSRDQVMQLMGSPGAVYQLRQPLGDSPYLDIDSSGTARQRIEYGGGSYGRHAYMFDFDANNRLLASAQVRSESRFNAIRAGMDEQQLLRTLGRPSNVWHLGFQSQNVWAYRFDSPFCQWFQVGVGYDGKVVDTAYGPDPMCEPLNEDPL